MGKYDGTRWGDLVRFQNEGEERLPRVALEEKLLEIAAVISADAGYFASRARRYYNHARNLPLAGDLPPEQLKAEMCRSLAYILGHIINAAHHLEADLLQEFADWSREIGLILPEAPYESR
jgi:hypothetical protein